jgi:hypothetical protein
VAGGAAEQLVYADAEVLRVQTMFNPPTLTVASTPAREHALAGAETGRPRLLLEVRRHDPKATPGRRKRQRRRAVKDVVDGVPRPR